MKQFIVILGLFLSSSVYPQVFTMSESPKPSEDIHMKVALSSPVTILFSLKNRYVTETLKVGDTIIVVNFTSPHFKIIFQNSYWYIVDSTLQQSEEIKMRMKVIQDAKKVKQDSMQAVTNYYFKKGLKIQDSLERVNEQIELKKQQKALQQKQQAKEERKKRILSTYGQADGNKILQGKIWIGMTRDMARESWGKPNDINRTVTASSMHEQWVYGHQYLYFDDGILTSFQD